MGTLTTSCIHHYRVSRLQDNAVSGNCLFHIIPRHWLEEAVLASSGAEPRIDLTNTLSFKIPE